MKQITNCFQNLWDKLTNYPTLGCENTNLADKLVSFLLVISPLLQHYEGIAVSAGIMVLVVCLPYVFLKLLLRFGSLQWKRLLWVLPVMLFQAFRVFDHGTTFLEIAHSAVLCGYFAAIVLGGINLKYIARSSYLVAMAACLCIIVQSICYYFFGFHLQVVVTEWLSIESSAWIKLVETGVIGVSGTVSGFYRPSAFFLEPSHMFLYFIPNLCLLLLTPEMNWAKRISAVLLSAGLLLSTSGMGIALVVGVWLVHLGFGKGTENLLRFQHLFTKQNILRCVTFALIFAVIVMALPFLRYSILRVFLGSQVVNDLIESENAGNNEDPVETTPGTEATVPGTETPTTPPSGGTNQGGQAQQGSTAISGRTERAISLILYRMKGMQYWVGVSDSVDDINFNLPGFFATMYKYGIIGTVLSYMFYLFCAVFGKGPYRWMAIIILGISFFSAHTHGTFYMLFYMLMLADGLLTKQKTLPEQA